MHKRFAVLAQCGGKTSTAEHPHLLKNYNHFFSFSLSSILVLFPVVVTWHLWWPSYTQLRPAGSHTSPPGEWFYTAETDKTQGKINRNATQMPMQDLIIWKESHQIKSEMENLFDFVLVWQRGQVLHWNLLSVHHRCDVWQKLWLIVVVNQDHQDRVIAIRDPKPFKRLWDLYQGGAYTHDPVLFGSLFFFMHMMAV